MMLDYEPCGSNVRRKNVSKTEGMEMLHMAQGTLRALDLSSDTQALSLKCVVGVSDINTGLEESEARIKTKHLYMSKGKDEMSTERQRAEGQGMGFLPESQLASC
eukprot:607210-Amphidinium_carterae.1